MIWLDNSAIRLGADLDAGGVITYLAPSIGGENVVNDHVLPNGQRDLGRQVQQSYYSGRRSLQGLWNPVGAGDSHGDPSTVVNYTSDGTTIYVESVPLQWAGWGIPCECTFEQWITLAGNTVRVRNRLTNNRADPMLYPAFGQELPAVYTIGRLPRLMTYAGNRPYSGEAVKEITAVLPHSARWLATEHWAAHVNADGWGLGVFSPSVTRFIGGFWGPRGIGGSSDDPTGYISPSRNEHLDWNIVYEYKYVLVLGSLSEIRTYAVHNRPSPRLSYDFVSSREGWTYVNVRDAGFPIARVLRVRLDQVDPQMWGPEGWWRAVDVPSLYVRMALKGTKQDRAEVFWSLFGGRFSAAQRIGFPVDPDGAFHTYRVDLDSSSRYAGSIGRLRLDPLPGGQPGAWADVDYVSSRPERRPVTVRRVGSGSVTSKPGGISCPPVCRARFAETTTVKLTARPARGFVFHGWSRDCEGVRRACRLRIDGRAATGARFVSRAASGRPRPHSSVIRRP